ncbi:HSF-type DNA-binding protein [Nitzschia inconspicua]|uniref:HSF-type DNA-binding protein n=1 Tax=Nitzschia inconspicua TaxID=303405 RepID=A0A9K3LCJ7_9STRA|nr:HSF-type DNA-binding protein [Nitzschia inconspicua]
MSPNTTAPISCSKAAIPPTPTPVESKRAMYTTKNEIKFPFRLHEMLDDAKIQGFDHIISWLPEGDGFRIIDANAFADEIMPQYFTMSHFKSFQRQLSLYSFKRETEGRKRDAYCHPYFRRDNRDLCVYVPREKKRPPKNKKARSDNIDRTHRRALSNEEVRNLMNSPSVSPISEDFESSVSGSNGIYQGIVSSSDAHPLATVSNGQQLSFFAQADQIHDEEQHNQPIRPPSDKPLQPQQYQQRKPQDHQLPPGRPLPFPFTNKGHWMHDHEASLWNYVNGLVVDSSSSLNNKKELAKEASNFSPDEILSEIASTFNSTGNERSSGRDSENGTVNESSGISTTMPLTAYPSPAEPRKESYNGATFYGV